MWKDIPDYKELYQGSEDGEIRNKKTGRILKPNKVANGYLQVKLCKNRLYKQHLVHKLILETFIGPYPFGMLS